MRVINFTEQSGFRKKRSYRWAFEAGLIIGVAIGLAVVFAAGVAWLHRPHYAAPVATVFAPVTEGPDAAEAMAGPTGAPLLWVARKGDATVYLFGGFSSSGAIASGWMDRRLFAAFDNADKVIFEVGAFPDVLPADLITLRPDAALFQRANALRKVSVGLDDHAEAGRVAAEGVTDDGFALPVEAWRTGDQKVLTDTLALLAQADPAGYEALIEKRNQAWLPAIEKALTVRGTTFVTVGAAHLIGPDGLVANLRANGYSVARLDAG